MAARKPRTVDAVPVVSEAWAQRRSGLIVPAGAQLAAGSYRAAENPRQRFRVIDGSGDFHLDDRTRLMLRAQSRDLERNNAFYDGLLTNYVTYVIGSGPRPIPATTNERFNTLAVELWREDAKNCLLDARRMFPWPVWCAMLLRCVVRDGDAGVQHCPDGSGLLLESERITEVGLDQVGRITGYRVGDPGPYGSVTSIDAGQMLPVGALSMPANRNRPSQTRGLPSLSASLDEWERLDSLNEAEIVSAEAAALPWIILTSPAGTMGVNKPRAGSTNQVNPGPARYDGWTRTDAGSMLGLPPGLDGKPWTPGRPNLDVPAFVRMNLRNLCNPLLPYELAFLDLGDLNYAGIRGIGKMGKRKIDDERTIKLEPVCSRMYRDWCRQQILRKRLPFTADFAKHTWDWDQLEIRDREKDASACAQEMENGTTTLQDELGPMWRDTITQLAREQLAKAEARAVLIGKVKALAAELGVPVSALLPDLAGATAPVPVS